jgi:N-acetylmuramoyl-L-alanine amidase
MLVMEEDPGNSYHGYTEKTLHLKLLLKSVVFETADFKVIYTRTTDVFYELANRPKIANKGMLICLFLFIVIQ